MASTTIRTIHFAFSVVCTRSRTQSSVSDFDARFISDHFISNSDPGSICTESSATSSASPAQPGELPGFPTASAECSYRDTGILWCSHLKLLFQSIQYYHWQSLVSVSASIFGLHPVSGSSSLNEARPSASAGCLSFDSPLFPLS